ncbi:unnamed protein product, partial [Meganyctiphanes norvegica]
LNSYATALTLQEEFLGQATLAIGSDIYGNIVQVMDYRNLSIWVVGSNVMPCAKVLGMRQTVPIQYVEDYTRHLRPTIQTEIQNYNITGLKNIFKLPGYHNQLSFFAGSQDLIRRNIQLRPELLIKARSFLQEIRKRRGFDLIFIGFHIRRTDYEKRVMKNEHIALPGNLYYQSAMAYYRSCIRNPVFVACSDDISYAKQ